MHLFSLLTFKLCFTPIYFSFRKQNSKQKQITPSILANFIVHEKNLPQLNGHISISMCYIFLICSTKQFSTPYSFIGVKINSWRLLAKFFPFFVFSSVLSNFISFLIFWPDIEKELHVLVINCSKNGGSRLQRNYGNVLGLQLL